MAWFGRGRAQRVVGDDWHRAILLHARTPHVYQQGWVEDTLEGRFQMVALVSTLVLRRLRAEGEDGRRLADLVYREVFSGFDHALREEGVGDATIARKVRKLGEEFFGLARAVDQALLASPGEAALVEVLARNGVGAAAFRSALARWLIEAEASLERLAGETVLVGAGGWGTGATES